MPNHAVSASPAAVILTNAKIVTPQAVIEGAIAVKDGAIERIMADNAEVRSWLDENRPSEIVDAEGRHVLPGLVDLHCDAIEKEVQPRPGTLFPLEMALLEFERKLPLHGITSMYHSLSLGVGLSLRGDHLLTGMVELIRRYRRERSVVRNGIHLRYEVSHRDGLPIVEQYIREKAIDYLSFMDHSPGQGQYRAPGSFERYVMKNQGVTRDEAGVIVEELMERRKRVDWESLRKLGGLAREKGISVASHDDDSPERVGESMKFGVSVCEFPINLETAEHAAKRGLHVCVGAPNIVRGGSHDHNLRAIDAIRSGAADIVCSDYHPSSLLAALYTIAGGDDAALPAAVRMATLHPARALGADRFIGSIEAGKAADLVVVDTYQGQPWVTRTIVGGRTVYTGGTRY